MRVSKRFRWEGAHRLAWHTDGCQNLHGHSYQLWVELKGSTDKNGMVIDFKEIKQVLAPLIESWDHALLVSEQDATLLKAIELLNSKHYVLPFDTTSENLCRYVSTYLIDNALDQLILYRISVVKVKLQETETCYAEYEIDLETLS